MYVMEYRIICNNWKYKIQYRKRFWFWTDLPILFEDFSFGGLVSFYGSVGSKEFETYQGALQYLRQHLGHDVEIKEARFKI
jgi:hypothetical protein